MSGKKRSASPDEDGSIPNGPANKKRIEPDSSIPSIQESLKHIQNLFREREGKRESAFNQWLEQQSWDSHIVDLMCREHLKL